jgi:hypothetical protein
LPAGTYHGVIKNVYMNGMELHIEVLLDKAIKEAKSEKHKKTRKC